MVGVGEEAGPRGRGWESTSRGASVFLVNLCPVRALEASRAVREAKRTNADAVFIGLLIVAAGLLVWFGLVYGVVALLAALT